MPKAAAPDPDIRANRQSPGRRRAPPLPAAAAAHTAGGRSFKVVPRPCEPCREISRRRRTAPATAAAAPERPVPRREHLRRRASPPRDAPAPARIAGMPVNRRDRFADPARNAAAPGETHRHVRAEASADLGQPRRAEVGSPQPGRAGAALPPRRPIRRRARPPTGIAWSSVMARARAFGPAATVTASAARITRLSAAGVSRSVAREAP